jgi:4-alpha-glucanotransferase
MSSLPRDRRSGILLHPTSLPGPHGVGDLGAGAHRFAAWLGEAGQRLWQVLPLGPTGFGDSPYQALSSRAGNPLLVSLETLRNEGWLDDAELAGAPAGDPARAAYEQAGP